MTGKDLTSKLLQCDLNKEIKVLCSCENEQLKELDLDAGEEISDYCDIVDIYQEEPLPFSEDKIIIKVDINL